MSYSLHILLFSDSPSDSPSDSSGDSSGDPSSDFSGDMGIFCGPAVIFEAQRPMRTFGGKLPAMA